MYNTVHLNMKIYEATNFWSRLRGLMFRKEPLFDEGLLLQSCNSIHMCFMFFAIDVVFLDRNNKVVNYKEQVKPWEFLLPEIRACSTLELPKGTIMKYGIKKGDVLIY